MKIIFLGVLVLIIVGIPLGIFIYKYSNPAPFHLSVNTRPSQPTNLPGTTSDIRTSMPEESGAERAKTS